jgi:hypothetical protein
MQAGAHEALQTHLRAKMLLSGAIPEAFSFPNEAIDAACAISVMQFFFGVGNPYSYLAETQLPKLAEETGVRFIWHGSIAPSSLPAPTLSE